MFNVISCGTQVLDTTLPEYVELVEQARNELEALQDEKESIDITKTSADLERELSMPPPETATRADGSTSPRGQTERETKRKIVEAVKKVESRQRQLDLAKQQVIHGSWSIGDDIAEVIVI